MNQSERRRYLIDALIGENTTYADIAVPADVGEQKRLLRSLMNVRIAAPITKEFADVQDAYLQEAIRERGIVRISDMEEIRPGIYLWRGDITRIECDAIVNAANSGMTGCYHPCHACIDNCIHTYAGIQLRNRCNDIMEAQGCEEPEGQAKLTPAYNLPCRYVLHTVGPMVRGQLTERHERLLRSCYRACLQTALDNDIKSIAFCCISTGVFMFPNERAAQLAVKEVMDFREQTGNDIKVIFNVFGELDETIYRRELGKA